MDEAHIERIQVRAYEIWEREGRVNGQDEKHWQQAVAEIAAADAYGLAPEKVRAMRKSATRRRKKPEE